MVVWLGQLYFKFFILQYLDEQQHFTQHQINKNEPDVRNKCVVELLISGIVYLSG